MLRVSILLLVLSPSLFAAQPNILHILADEMGWNALGCYGNKDVQTPNLDRLAVQGMRFRRLTPSTNTRRRISFHCSIFVNILLVKPEVLHF